MMKIDHHEIYGESVDVVAERLERVLKDDAGRKFKSCTPVVVEGRLLVMAVATDGTAWWGYLTQSVPMLWHRIDDLPADQ